MRLGILGGSFDPIHLGHLLVAEQARDLLGLDRVLFIPASRPPHKPGRALAPWGDRARMVALAIEGVPGFELSDLERDDEQPNFTVETLRRLRERNLLGDDGWLLLGGDSLEEISTWREPEAIVRLVRLAVYARPGWTAGSPDDDPALRPPAVAAWEREGRIRWIPGPPLLLSSSEIRDRVARGRSIRYLVPEPVRGFIDARGLYRAAAGGGPASGPAGGTP